MTPERWQQISRVYQSALEQAPSSRAAFVADACHGDSDLRREVESLLAREDARVLVDQPVGVAAAAVLGSAAGLAPGTSIGPYRVTTLLGEGGMGQVYRAHDTKLQRDVALKILPDAFVHDRDRVARFTREAQVLASLNHPNIGAIYGFEESGEVHALVLELVEGPTLADRIARGPLPLDEAMEIARQIADALEAAHEHGIVHRDLKPANIKVRDDGTVKVLDFGLAKPTEVGLAQAGHYGAPQPDARSVRLQADLTHSPTIMSPAMTAMGVILGTAAYMSPEQAKGKPADKRSDIWAFGCVLYEMLTGKRAFDGEDVSDTLAAVLRGDPDWSRLPPSTPTRLVTLLERCLHKDRRRRVADISTARFVLEEPTPDPSVAGVSLLARHPRLAIGTALFVGATLAALVAAAILNAPSQSNFPSVRLEITTGLTSDPASLAVSPDGRFVTYVETADGVPQLWLRALDASRARRLERTDRASNPFWSPDSRAIAFFADGMLKRVDLQDGVVRTVTRASGGNRGGTWSTQGIILFVRTNGSPIHSVSADGGESSIAVPMSSPRVEQNFPSVLPDGKRILYFLNDLDNADRNGVYVRDENGRESRLLEADAAAMFVAPSHVMFVRQGKLLVQEVDLSRLRPVGTARPLADDVMVDPSRTQAAFSASNAGVVVYRVGAAVRQPRQLVWVDRSGRELQRFPVLDDGTAAAPGFALSPDAQHVALSRIVNGVQEVWIFGLRDGTLNKVTFNGGASPQWSPDGRRLIFRRPGSGVIVRPAFGAATEEQLPEVQGAPTDWARDGKHVLLRLPSQASGFDVWAVTPDEKKARPILQTRFDELDAQFSPDGRWVAYQSNESGRFEIYLQEFDGPGKLQVSTEGGAQARWHADGNELFYIALDGRLMAVPVRGRDQIELGAATALFPTRVGGAVNGVAPQQYAVSADGQRFLMNTVADQLSTPINVVLNWRQ